VKEKLKRLRIGLVTFLDNKKIVVINDVQTIKGITYYWWADANTVGKTTRKHLGNPLSIMSILKYVIGEDKITPYDVAMRLKVFSNVS